MIIDAHHHFWHYTTTEFAWIDESMASLRRNFFPSDLQAEIAAAGVDGVITVQARQSEAETRWLLELAAQNSFIAGVVGWIPLASRGVHAALARFAGDPKLVAVRHVLQDEPDPMYMLGAEFQAGIRALGAFGLAYDILIHERHLPQAIELVDGHPAQVFVLDHMAKPLIRTNALEPWARHIRELARRPHVTCKLSGLATEVGRMPCTSADLRPYFDVVLEAFGPRRLLFGSDWPVCLVACGYKRWMDVVQDLARNLSPDERAAILGENARRVYRRAPRTDDGGTPA